MRRHESGTPVSADETSWRYPGWRIVAVLFLLQIVMFGFGLYGQGIYVAELRRLNGWPTGLIAAGSTLCLVLGNVLSMFASDLLRWIGARALALAGIAALAAGLGLLASADTLLQLHAGFVVLALAWVGLGTITAATILGAWFDRKRGLAISLTFTGATFSGILLVPGLVLLIEAQGFRHALGLAAVLSVIVLAPIVLLTMRLPHSGEHRKVDVEPSSPPLSRLQLLRDGGFWSATAPFAMALFVQVAFIVHQISILTPAIGFQQAGVAVSVTTAMSLIGRLGLMLVADRIDPRRAAAVSVFSQAVALLVIGTVGSTDVVLYVACGVFGFSIGNLVTLPALIVQREFAREAFGTVLGLGMGIAGLVNACGPAAMGLLRDATGGYATPIFFGVAIQVGAVMVLLGTRRRQIGLPA